MDAQLAHALGRSAPDLKPYPAEPPPFPTLLPRLQLSWHADQAIVALLLAIDSRLSSSARGRHLRAAADMLGDSAIRVESMNRLLGLMLPPVAVSRVPDDANRATDLLSRWFELQPAIHFALQAWNVASSETTQKREESQNLFAELVSSGVFASVVGTLGAGSPPSPGELPLRGFSEVGPKLTAWYRLLNPRQNAKQWIAFLGSYLDSLRDAESLRRSLPAGLFRRIIDVAAEAPWPPAQRMELSWLLDACTGAMSDDWFTELKKSRTALSDHEMSATLSACWRAMSLQGGRSSPWVVLGINPSRVFSTGDLSGETAIRFRASAVKIVPINTSDAGALRTAKVLDSVARQCSARRYPA